MQTTADHNIGLIATVQYGTFSRRQALDAGATPTSIHRRLRNGRWRAVRPGTYVLAGVPPSWEQELWAVYVAIGPGATVTHETAAVLHGVPGVPVRPFTFTARHGTHHRIEGAVVHQIEDLTPARTRVHRVTGLPTSTPPRTVVECAATMGRRRLGELADEAVRAKITSYAAISDCLAEIARPGKPGLAKLAAVLDERGPGHVPEQSVLEGRLFAVLAAGGLPAPVRQHPLPGRGAIDGVVDAAFPEYRLILEADGRRWHTRVRDLARDHARDAEAATVGWQTLRFLHEQLCEDGQGVCRIVRSVLAARRPSPPSVPEDLSLRRSA